MEIIRTTLFKRNRRAIEKMLCLVALMSGFVLPSLAQEKAPTTWSQESVTQQHVMSLDACKLMALQHNHELKVEEQKILGAKAKRGEVMSHFLPQISLQAGWMQVDKRFRVIDWDYLIGDKFPLFSSLLDPFTSFRIDDVRLVSAMGVQPLFLGGKLYHGTKMADAAVQLRSTMAETKRTEVEQKLEETYWQVVKLESKKNLVDKLIELLDKAVHNVDLAVKEGVATRADALSIRVKRSEAEVNKNKVRNGLHLSRMLLSQQCGLGPNDLIIPEDVLSIDSLGNRQCTQEPLPIDSTRMDAYVEKRSEVRSLLLADTIFAHKEGVEGSDMLPKAFLFGGYTASNPNPYHAPRHELRGSWAIGVGVSVPITGILTGSFKRKQAHTERVMKQIELTDAKEKITLQMNQALLNRKEGLLALEAAEKNLQHAEENLRYANVGYKEGVIPLLNLTTAQTAWAKAHDAYIDAYVDAQLNECKIKHIFVYD